MEIYFNELAAAALENFNDPVKTKRSKVKRVKINVNKFIKIKSLMQLLKLHKVVGSAWLLNKVQAG